MGGNNGTIVNNTIWGAVTACAFNIGNITTGGAVLQNNVFNNVVQQTSGTSGLGLNDVTGGGSVSTSNYNDWYRLNTSNTMLYQYFKTGFAAYQSSTGFDANSITSNPNLNSSYQPIAGSPVIKAGTNLYSVCNGQPNPGLGALCFDAAG